MSTVQVTPVKEKSFTALFVGRYTAAKGVHVLLSIAQKLQTEGVSLWLAGSGPLTATVNNYPVHNFGQVAPENLRDLYAQADVIVLPTYTEGFPNTILEAMAMAKPVIVSQVDGLAEIVKNNHNGLLVPAGDAQALFAAIAWLKNNPNEARIMGQRNRSFVEKNCSWQSIAQRYQALFESYQPTK